MRIGFDGKRTTQNLTGLGNYGRYIVGLLAKFNLGSEHIIFALKPPLPNLKVTGALYSYPSDKSIKSLWRSFGIVKDLSKQKIDLFHGLSNEIPYGLKTAHIPSVVTIHDLIFLRYPKYYSIIDRIIYKIKFRYAANHADRIIAISNQTKNDLINYLNIKEERISVIYQSCDPVFYQPVSKASRNAVIKKHNLPEKYILNVGTIEERKNLMLVAQALTKIEDVQLVVIGKETSYTKKVKEFIRSNKLSERIHFLHTVQHSDLPAIFQQAQLFVYPSRFEGFGIPVIEALHSGIPVIAATGSCLEEAGGPGSIYVDPDNAEELAEKMRYVLDNNDKRRLMIAEGKKHLEQFQDATIAAQISQLYKNIIHNA